MGGGARASGCRSRGSAAGARPHGAPVSAAARAPRPAGPPEIPPGPFLLRPPGAQSYHDHPPGPDPAGFPRGLPSLSATPGRPRPCPLTPLPAVSCPCPHPAPTSRVGSWPPPRGPVSAQTCSSASPIRAPLSPSAAPSPPACACLPLDSPGCPNFLPPHDRPPGLLPASLDRRRHQELVHSAQGCPSMSSAETSRVAQAGAMGQAGRGGRASASQLLVPLSQVWGRERARGQLWPRGSQVGVCAGGTRVVKQSHPSNR